MKRHFVIFVIVFLVTIGFAAANTVLDITGSLNVAENIEDFKIEITNLKINNNDSITLISKDKHSFTFKGSGNDTLEYTVTNYSYQYDANISLICTPSDNIIVEQISDLPAQSKNSKVITSTNTSEITCTTNVEKISRTDYADDICKDVVGTVWTFDYTGSEQKFTTPCDGSYKIETWGAQGGSATSTYIGGYGAYSYGIVLSKENNLLYINVGGKGTTTNVLSQTISGGYNGGGSAKGSLDTPAMLGSGGGATHISLTSGLLSSLENKKNQILIVSAGGGGSIYHKDAQIFYGSGGHGGGIKGVDAYNYYDSTSRYYPGYGATQIGSVHPNRETLNGSFGLGGSEPRTGTLGGGGGFYGGTGSTLQPAGGGSSYIGNVTLTDKSMYCYRCEESNEESTKTVSTTCTSSTPTSNCAKQGNGYAKITYLGK